MSARPVAVLVIAAAASCASHAVRMDATPLEPGARSTALGLDLLVFERGRRYFALPNPELALRWGLREGSDAGGRANLFGVGVTL